MHILKLKKYKMKFIKLFNFNGLMNFGYRLQIHHFSTKKRNSNKDERFFVYFSEIKIWSSCLNAKVNEA